MDKLRYKATPPSLSDGMISDLLCDTAGALKVTLATALPPGTDRSGSITTGGTAQVLAAANTARRSLSIFNNSGDALWVNQNGGTAAVGGAGSIQITSFGPVFYVETNKAISIIGATTGQKFTATET